MFFKKSVLNNFALFVGKYLCWSLFLIKLQPLGLQKQVFSCEYCEIFKNTFLRNTSSGCFWINTGGTRNTDNPFTHTIWAMEQVISNDNESAAPVNNALRVIERKEAIVQMKHSIQEYWFQQK